MKTLFAIILGVVIGLGAMLLTAKPYSTSSESNERLYEIVWGWTNRV